MLVLGRKENETLVIADSIVLRITQIRGNRVTIGIEAPRDVTILRGELVPPDNSEQPRSHRWQTDQAVRKAPDAVNLLPSRKYK